MALERLYARSSEFRLVDVDGVILTNPNDFININEPVGFGDAKIILERDGRGGFDFEYGDEETLLGFNGTFDQTLAESLPDGNSGRWLINAIYNQIGVDLNVKLEYYNNGSLLYEGFLIGSSLNELDAVSEFRVKRFDFGNRLKTRFNAVINVEDSSNLDGGVMTPLAMREFALHSNTFLDIYSANATLYNEDILDGSNIGIMSFRWSSPNGSDQTPDGFDGQSWFLLDYINNKISSSQTGNEIFTYNPVLASFSRPNRMVTFQGTNNFQIQSLVISNAETLKFFTVDFTDLSGTITLNHSLNVSVDLGGSNAEFTSFIRGRITITEGLEIPVESFIRSGTDVILTVENEFTLQVGDKIVVRGFNSVVSGSVSLDFINGIKEITNISGNDITFSEPTNSALSTLNVVTIEKIISETNSGVDSVFHDTDDPPAQTTLSLSDSQDYAMSRGQRLYFYYLVEGSGSFTPTGNGLLSITSINQADLSLNINSQQIPTICESSYFNETLDKALEAATGTPNLLESSIFQNRPVNGLLEGCGGLNINPTGFKIRQRNEPLRVSIGEMISFAESRLGCGFAIYYDAGIPKFLLEEDVFFFQDKLILEITNLHNPTVKTVNKTILANELTVGFNKFAKPNESGTSEGFSTRSDYLNPLEKDENKLEFLSDLIGDGSEIERVRRNGIQNANDEADEKDDDTFTIKIHEFGDTEFYDPSLYGSGEFLNIQRDADNSRIIINGLIINDVQQNDYINIDGATNRQIDGTPILDLENNRTILPCSTETQNDIIYNAFNFRLSDDLTPRYTYNPERLEGFNSVSGLIDARTVYNLDHANTQFLLWNFGWFGGSLNKKDGSKTVKFLTKKAITTLEKAYDSDTCGLTSDLINERQDFTLSNLRALKPAIFNEFVYEVDAQLGINDLLRLKEALRNESLEDINYGYIQFTDNFGNSVQAYPFKIEYNPVTLRTNFICWGKA